MQRMVAGQPIDKTPAATDEPGTPIGRINAAFNANYGAVQYHYVQFLTEHIVDCSRTFGGDFDQVLLLAVLGQRFMNAARFDSKELPQNDGAIWMPAMRIADVTGLPRETVRRKLKALEARGWARQKPGMGWALVGSFEHTVVRDALAGLDARGLERLARLFVAIRQILAEDEPPGR